MKPLGEMNEEGMKTEKKMAMKGDGGQGFSPGEGINPLLVIHLVTVLEIPKERCDFLHELPERVLGKAIRTFIYPCLLHKQTALVFLELSTLPLDLLHTVVSSS